jgi:hypothetical protein
MFLDASRKELSRKENVFDKSYNIRNIELCICYVL